VEWNVGQAAATIAALWLESGGIPKASVVQEQLARAGVPMVWFDDLSADHPSFAAVQLAALREIYPMNGPDLHASPDAPVTRLEAAQALVAFFDRHGARAEALTNAVREGWMAVDHRNWTHGDLPFYWTDWREDKLPSALQPLRFRRTGPVRRWELAERLCGVR